MRYVPVKQLGKGKRGDFFFFLYLLFIWALKGLADAHPRWEEQWTLPNPPIQMLISSRNTDTPRNNIESAYTMAQSN